MSTRQSASEPASLRTKASRPPRFIADAMLGKLARWLRVAGFDVVYDPRLDDRQLVALARHDDRILLTRDTLLARRRNGPRTLHIENDDFREQLRQVVATYALDPWRRVLTRCVDCNGLLGPVPREEVREQVPVYVYFTRAEFKRCPSCSKILWGGTHRDRMLRLLERLFGSPGGSRRCTPAHSRKQ